MSKYVDSSVGLKLTVDPEIKSEMLNLLSHPGLPVVCFFNEKVNAVT